MNSVCLVGRLTRDPEIGYTNAGKTIAKFGVAVDRRGKDAGADFINVVTFDKTAEIVEKWFRKGQRIGINGRIQTGSYTNKEGKKVYTFDVVGDSIEFVESRGAAATPAAPADADGFVKVPDDVPDEGLPFN